ncbi:MAG: hypothetical protein AAGG48_13555 [Planctomycetota bacterium]
MSLIVDCPGCGAQLSVNEDALGRQLACPKCDHRFTVAADQPAAEAEPIVAQPDPLAVDTQADGGNIDSFFGASGNPYQQPIAPVGQPNFEAEQLNLSPADVKKIEAIISDAKMVVVAVLLCLLCSGCGFLIIGPWYFVRLSQWNNWAEKCPGLLNENVSFGSLPQRFQDSKRRLIIGLVIGAVMLGLVGLVVVASTLIG